MSGTSVDGIDVALVAFSATGPQTLATTSVPFELPLAELINDVAAGRQDNLHMVATLDALLATAYATVINRLIADTGHPASAIKAIGCHGQTVRHAPHAVPAYTVQLGNPALLAELTGITTVADFRRRDLAAGGQAAPLAPGFHQALFANPLEDRVVANLGGIGNISILPANRPEAVTGFDTGPANTLMDAWYRRHHGGRYDAGGQWAASADADEALLAHLMKERYFQRKPPKSTGPELFNLAWLQTHLTDFGQPLGPTVVQATLAELTARSVADAAKAAEPARLLVCGGGIHNAALMSALKRAMGAIPVESTAAYGVDPDFVEAVGFAWLAARTLAGLPGNLPAVTGARGSRILGAIYPA